MRRFLFPFFLFFIGSLVSQTIIPAGNVSGTWTAADSPYQVQGLIVVQDGQTLTVEAGTTIEFVSAGRLRVKGNLRALGTSVDPILFTAQDISNGWNSIMLDSVNAASDSTIFEHCTMEYGKQTGLLQITGFSKVRVQNCTLQNANGYSGGAVRLWSSSAVFKNNLIQENEATSGYGGAFYINGGAPLIERNTIINNDGYLDGGAIHAVSSSTPIIHDNQISSNIAASGGAIHLGNWCDATITDNVFDGNSAYYDGGVIWANRADPLITGNIFTHNEAGDEGGAIFFPADCEVVCSNNVFDENEARYGGAIFMNDNSIVSFSENVFTNNYAITSGGALTIEDDSHSDVVNCIFSNNYSGAQGGALYINANCDPTFINCTFTNNRSNNGGAFMASLNVAASFNNCTFANNSANNRGGAIYLYWSASPVFTNCIFKGDVASDSGPVMYCQYYSNNPCNPSFVHCNIEDGQAGFVLNENSLGSYVNNIDADPLFVSSSSGTGELFDGISANWQLSNISPCFNAGKSDTNGLILPPTDLAGADRVILDTVDIGAYEIVPDATILSQTSDQEACEGDSVLLTISSSGQTPMSYQWQYNGTDITGATDDTLNFTANQINDGTYTCIATNSYAADTTAPIEVTVYSAPVLTSLGADTAFCQGNDLVLTADSGQYTYNWNDGLSNLDSIVISSSGSYYYAVEDSNSCTAYSDTIEVNTDSLPEFTFGPDITQCDSGLISLYSGITGASYDWNSGQASSDSIYADTSGMYTLTVTDSNGCVFTDTINITLLPLPVIDLMPDDSLCEGDSVILHAGPGFAAYDWNNGLSNADSLVVTNSGNFFVSVTDGNNCIASDTANFHFNSLPEVSVGPSTTLCVNHEALSLSTSPNGGSLLGEGVDQTSFYPDVAGIGTHVITYTYTDQNGCTGSDSTSIVVEGCAGVSEINKEQIHLYPNPNNGVFTLVLPNEVQNGLLRISDLKGSTLYSKTLNEKQTTLNLDLPSGIYLLELYIDNLKLTLKVVVK